MAAPSFLGYNSARLGAAFGGPGGMRKQLWLACVVCALGVLPGLFVGEFAAMIWRWSAESFLGSEPDFYFLRTLFGIETPGCDHQVGRV
jgi:hypothetical protein